MGLFVDLAEFTCFYQFLHDVIIKLFCFDLQNRRNFYNALVVVIDCWVVGGQLFSALECVIKVKSREKRY